MGIFGGLHVESNRGSVSGMQAGIVEQSVRTGASREVIENVSSDKSSSALQNLSAGDTITGQMISREGDVVQLLLSDETVIQAKLDREMQMQPGQMITFTVKTTNNGNIALAPLFTNTTDMKTAAKALMNAGLSVNDGNMKMVSSMMKEGLPIGRDSLVYMKGQSALFPTADVTNLVQMHRMGIPMTEQNVEQFSAYKNYEHQVLDAANHIGELVGDTLGEMVSANPSEAVAFFDTILELMTENNSTVAGDAATMTNLENAYLVNDYAASIASDENNNFMPGEEATKVASDKAQDIAPGNLQNGSSEINAVVTGQVQNASAQDTDATIAMLKAIMQQGNTAFMSDEQMGQARATGQPGEAALQETQIHPDGSVMQSGGTNSVQETMEQLLRDLEAYTSQNDTAKQLVEDFARGNISGADLLKHLKQECKDPAQFRALLSNHGVQKLLGKSLTDAWKLTAEQTSSKTEVKELYRRMEEQTRQIMDTLQASAKADSPLASAVTKLQNNLDFMNQLNQMFPYVQLPLSLSGSEAHGELYVYTNKKNLAKENGSVSALLHLDMEHLGTVDVMVRMNSEQHVNTNFMVASEAVLDLIESHLDELTARLNKRGYHMETSCSLQEEDGSVMDKMIEQDRPISVISTTAFDARA